MGEIYDIDILEWSHRQGDLLRSIADGHPANERPDWTNIIEEIESVGRSELRAVESLLTNAIIHDLKCEAWPLSLSVPHWRAEARLFRRQAGDRITPSMKNRLDLSRLFANAVAGLPDHMDGVPAAPTSRVADRLMAGTLMEDPPV